MSGDRSYECRVGWVICRGFEEVNYKEKMVYIIIWKTKVIKISKTKPNQNTSQSKNDHFLNYFVSAMYLYELEHVISNSETY